jgi:YHS domain-containing protein
MKRTTTISALAAALVMLAGVTVWAGSKPGSDTTTSRAYLHSFNLPSTGVALEGYCPVAYFAVDKAIRGKAEYASTYNGVTYHFVSDDARSAFEREPEKYLPAYGGWCAFGMAVQDKFPVDPTNFEIVDGRLLLFLRNQGVDARALWNQGIAEELFDKADAHWAKVSG